MNKYLFLFLLIFIGTEAKSEILPVFDEGLGGYIVKVSGNENLDEIKSISAVKYEIKNSCVVIDNFSDWQNWDADVKLKENVILRINGFNDEQSGSEVKHMSASDAANVSIEDAHKLYKINFYTYEDVDAVFIRLVRETDYEKVFNDSRGQFIENLRKKHPDDKMISALDSAKGLGKIESIMKSAYHFNPMVLMNPIKTINRSFMLDMIPDEEVFGAGVKTGYIMSGKIKDFYGDIYVSGKYEDLYLNIGIDLNKYSYTDSFNEFDGFSYGANIHARQYFNNVWLDGLIGIKKALFYVDDVYVKGNVKNNPDGISEYGRLSVGYNYNFSDDILISPFMGAMFQRSEILDVSDDDINLLLGTNVKYNFSIDGIKYEYIAMIASDEDTNWHIGANIGFISLVDDAGASFGIDAFKDEFDINYKLSLKAKMQF